LRHPVVVGAGVLTAVTVAGCAQPAGDGGPDVGSATPSFD
jgi:hypothetical protein